MITKYKYKEALRIIEIYESQQEIKVTKDTLLPNLPCSHMLYRCLGSQLYHYGECYGIDKSRGHNVTLGELAKIPGLKYINGIGKVRLGEFNSLCKRAGIAYNPNE